MGTPGKLLALDVGLARIGVATCDPLQLAVRPHTVVRRTSRRADFEKLAALVKQEEPAAILCGLPLNMDGSEGPQAQMVRKWALRLAHALRALLGRSPPILFWDERLSTFAAQELLALTPDQGEDAVAAAVILQSYLDAARLGETRDYGRIDLLAE
jgi:putative Holliday junction resolvase